MGGVAAVIPTFDRRAMVLEAVASVLGQSHPVDEVIVADDGSTDGTAAALAREFGSRVRVLRLAHRGVSAARNAGVAAARSPLIAFLDSDDLWKPRKIEAQLAFLASHPDLDICQTEEIWMRRGVRVNPRRHHAKPAGDIFLPSLDLCLVSPSAVLLRRSLLQRSGGFDESFPACEDYDLWLRISMIARLGLVPEALVVKRGGHPDQLSQRYWGMDRFRVAALLKVLHCAPLADPARRHAVATTVERKCAILAGGAEKRGRVEEAERYRRLGRHALACIETQGYDA